jgi:hypothetical protein
VSRDQLKVMTAIERCRTAALGGHVARCENAACGYTAISYNSFRNRHCPKCPVCLLSQRRRLPQTNLVGYRLDRLYAVHTPSAPRSF